MEQNNMQKNQNESFFQKNQNYIIAGVIVVLLIIYFATQKPADNTLTDEEQQTEQMTSEENSNSSETKSDETKEQEPAKAAETPTSNNNQASAEVKEEKPATSSTAMEKTETTTATGNLNIAGKLMTSDNASRGNLMVVKGSTNYYISTKRDFTSLLNKDVTLVAEGTADKYTFVGFKEATSTTASNTGTDTDAKGGSNETPPATMPGKEEDGTVSFGGTLRKSDDSAKGNYIIESTSGKIYVKTGKDYSAWLDKAVDAKASGTLQSFSNLVLTEKK